MSFFIDFIANSSEIKVKYKLLSAKLAMKNDGNLIS